MLLSLVYYFFLIEVRFYYNFGYYFGFFLKLLCIERIRKEVLSFIEIVFYLLRRIIRFLYVVKEDLKKDGNEFKERWGVLGEK